MLGEENPALAVDVIIEMEGGVVLVERRNEPFQGKWAIPGGFVEMGETVEEAARREVKEETGLDVDVVDLVGIYSEPGRDPRGHVVSICFRVSLERGDLRPASDASSVKVFKDIPWSNLAFDHDKILKDANIR